jgi:hypothetical protein
VVSSCSSILLVQQCNSSNTMLPPMVANSKMSYLYISDKSLKQSTAMYGGPNGRHRDRPSQRTQIFLFYHSTKVLYYYSFICHQCIIVLKHTSFLNKLLKEVNSIEKREFTGEYANYYSNKQHW